MIRVVGGDGKETRRSRIGSEEFGIKKCWCYSKHGGPRRRSSVLSERLRCMDFG